MTSLLTVKLRWDLRVTWPRMVLMVVAIAVSLTAFGAVLYGWTAIGRETERAYLSTEPASATIRFMPGIDADGMAAIVAAARGRPGVIEAAGWTQFRSDVEAGGRLRELPLQVFAAAPGDPMRMANFEVRPGSWPPPSGEILLRGDSFGLLDVAVGDTVTVETPDGEPARLRVAGSVYDPSLAPAGQQQTGRGYLSTASLAALGEPDVFDQLKLQVAEPGEATRSRDRDAIVAVAGDVAAWLQQEYGLAVQEIQVPNLTRTPTKDRPTPCSVRCSSARAPPCCWPRCWSRTCSTTFRPADPADRHHEGDRRPIRPDRTPVPGNDADGGCGGHPARAGPRHPDRPRSRPQRVRIPGHRGRQPRAGVVDLPCRSRRRPRPARGDGPGAADQGQSHPRSGRRSTTVASARTRVSRPTSSPGLVGEGLLVRQLHGRVPTVVGIDSGP